MVCGAQQGTSSIPVVTAVIRDPSRRPRKISQWVMASSTLGCWAAAAPEAAAPGADPGGVPDIPGPPCPAGGTPRGTGGPPDTASPVGPPKYPVGPPHPISTPTPVDSLLHFHFYLLFFAFHSDLFTFINFYFLFNHFIDILLTFFFSFLSVFVRFSSDLIYSLLVTSRPPPSYPIVTQSNPWTSHRPQ